MNEKETEQIYKKLESNIPNFEYREDQLEYSNLINKAFFENKIAVLEAGVGFGKTWAYLIPVILEASKNENKKIVISTSSKVLQITLFEQLKKLSEKLEVTIKPTVLFGKDTYVCENKLYQALKNDGIFDNQQVDEIFTKVFIDHYGLKSEKDGISYPIDTSRMGRDDDNCKKYPCYTNCILTKLKSEAKTSQIIIVNHDLLLSDLKYRFLKEPPYNEDVILPPFSKLVIDEPHFLPEKAFNDLAMIFSMNSFKRLIHCLQKSIQSAKDVCIFPLLPDLKTEEICDSIKNLLNNMLDAVERVEHTVSKYVEKNESAFLSNKELTDLKNKGLIEEINLLFENRKHLIKKIDEFKNEIDSIAWDFLIKDDLLYYLKKINYEFYSLDNWKLYNSKMQYSIEKDDDNISLITRHKDSSDWFRGVFNSGLESVIFTSATLYINNKLDFSCAVLGLDQDSIIAKKYDSPFDYEKAMLFLYVDDNVDVNEKEKEKENKGFREFTVKSIKEAVMTSHGGALLLFSAKNNMEHAYSELNNEFQKKGIKVLKQCDTNKDSLIQKFIANPDSVLFALTSFYEGVDIPGPALRLLVIDKLPFKSPDDIQLKFLKSQGVDTFDYNKYRTIIKFKQGVGRLIRSAKDRGVCLVLDPRLHTQSYGSSFINALPECKKKCISQSNIQDEITEFFKKNNILKMQLDSNQ